jgi:hypothetical protein
MLNRLDADQRLNVNDELMSMNGRARLVMQGDGNLVLYRTDDGRALWASDTSQQPIAYTVMQGDGNFVAYSADGRPYWATDTEGHAGAWVVLQDDANLVVYDSASSPLWASNTVQPFGPVVVAGFRPTTHAPLFSNGKWPPGTQLWISVMGLPSVSVDATRFGLCGGMSFLTRDIVESGTPQLRGTDSTKIPPALVGHIFARLVDSFSLTSGITDRWLAATRALDHDTVVWGHGLFHQTVDEVPGILAEVDAGRLCPIGIVLAQSYLPWAVFDSHVVLVWGYETHGDILTLRTYDCNKPGKDDIVIELDISSPTPSKTITTNGTDVMVNNLHTGTVRGFFKLPYTHQDPSPAYIDDAVAGINTSPARMEPGALAMVKVVVSNTGSTTWTPAATYRLGSQVPQDNTTWGLGRVELQAATVDPQQVATFTFQVTAPSTPGRYEFCWRMLREGVAWFGLRTPVLQIAIGSDVGVCDALHQQAQSLAEQLQDIQAQIDTIDLSDPVTARHEVAELAGQATNIREQLTAVETQQQANGCSPG